MTADAPDSTTLRIAAHRLNAAIGLDCESVGTSALCRAVKARSRALGLEGSCMYADRLASDPDEIKGLVEEMVVPETWFFRDREPFKLLARYAAERLGKGMVSFKVLSAPCSTGEEPYSIAMSLLEAGLDPARISVVGTDISDRALAVAETGRYGPNSFRGAEPGWSGHWFENAGKPDCRRVCSEVRRVVSFQKANLAPRPDESPHASPGASKSGTAWDTLARTGRFDAVFCRNFLIYMDKEAKRRVAEHIRDILVQDGLLFVGHAEMTPMLQKRFSSIREPGCFAYRNRVPESAAPPPAPAPPVPRPRTKAARPVPVTKQAPKQTLKQVPKQNGRPAPDQESKQPVKPKADATWETARAHADRGELDRAEHICRTLIERGDHTADVYHLMGVIQEARGNAGKAKDYFGKALYLDPNHRAGLYSMALHSERTGDTAAGARYRDRLRRATQRNG